MTTTAIGEREFGKGTRAPIRTIGLRPAATRAIGVALAIIMALGALPATTAAWEPARETFGNKDSAAVAPPAKPEATGSSAAVRDAAPLLGRNPLTPAAIRLKSEAAAYKWSLWGTLVPWGIAMAATSEIRNSDILIAGFATTVIAGPSLGCFYAGETRRGLTGVGLRMLGAAAAVSASRRKWKSRDDDDPGYLSVLVLAGHGLFWGSTVYDIATAKRTVRKHNAGLQAKSSTVAVAPIISPVSKTVGLQVRIAF